MIYTIRTYVRRSFFNFFKLLCPGLASQAAPQGRPRASVFSSKAGFEQFYIFAPSSISLLLRLRHLNCNIKNKTKNADINVANLKQYFVKNAAQYNYFDTVLCWIRFWCTCSISSVGPRPGRRGAAVGPGAARSALTGQTSL